eukprot:TRINITY_DN90477_c0_g1_i1.p1 TRINITY_DN90477_c0_g1~~TRINITY_DN90477_c0_g1_i1.p1  ORF type:complete len:229 (-),score=36.02 TRINITY_DN90477_c0_g1_i1:115-768(-)
MGDSGAADTTRPSGEESSQLSSAISSVANRVSRLLSVYQQDAPESPAAQSGSPGASSAGAAVSQLPDPPSSLRQNFGVYDESLQEDLFLGKIAASELQIKNTFLHVPEKSSLTVSTEDAGGWQSAPGVLIEKSWRTKFPAMEAAHNRGECKPCAYFLYKADGCRNSDNCPYCHLCTRGEIKRRKKKKIKAIKAASKAANSENPTLDSDDDIVDGDFK